MSYATMSQAKEIRCPRTDRRLRRERKSRTQEAIRLSHEDQVAHSDEASALEKVAVAVAAVNALEPLTGVEPVKAAANAAVSAAVAAAKAAESKRKAITKKLISAVLDASASSDELSRINSADKRSRLNIMGYTDAVLPTGTLVSVSGGDKWHARTIGGGFICGSKIYNSPRALTKAHASRITAKHPQPTNPTNGWNSIMVESGKYKGMTIKEAFQAHFTAVESW